MFFGAFCASECFGFGDVEKVREGIDVGGFSDDASGIGALGGFAEGGVTTKPKVTAEKDGVEIKFNKTWGGHTFTQTEVATLLAGEYVDFDFKKKNGETGHVKGKLAKQKYKGHSFWGFKPEW